MTELAHPRAGPSTRRRPSAGAVLNQAGAAIALVALLLFNTFLTRDFLTLQTLNLNILQVAQIVVVAMGMALVVATGGIDLSVGAAAAFAGTMAAVLLSQTSGPLARPQLAMLAALTLPIIAAAGFGAVNGALIARYRVQPIVATLVLFIAGRGFAEMLTESNLRSFSGGQLDWLKSNLAGLPVQGFVMLAVVAGAFWLMRSTLFGRWVLATGGNERAARLAGVPAARVKLGVYVACAGLAGLAGIMNVAMISAADPAKIGQNIELDAIAAVAVGGTPLSGGRARIVGTLVGALVIQLLDYTLLANGVPDEYALLVKAAIILLAVYSQRPAR